MPSADEFRDFVAELRRRDPGCRRFGAGTHRYRLLAPALPAEVSDFESRFRVELPEDLRWFLLNVANGGAGPAHGLLSLSGMIAQGLSELDKPFEPSEDGVEEQLYLAPGCLPIAQYGCGNMALLVVTGAERGFIWDYTIDDHYVPFTNLCPLYPAEASYDQILAVNREFLARTIRSRMRYRFSDWYWDWLQRELASESR